MKTFRGTRIGGKAMVTVNGENLIGGPFEWGAPVGERGIRLASAIVCSVDQERATARVAYDFADRCLRSLPHDGWALSEKQVADMIVEIKHDIEIEFEESKSPDRFEEIHA